MAIKTQQELPTQLEQIGHLNTASSDGALMVSSQEELMELILMELIAVKTSLLLPVETTMVSFNFSETHAEREENQEVSEVTLSMLSELPLEEEI